MTTPQQLPEVPPDAFASPSPIPVPTASPVPGVGMPDPQNGWALPAAPPAASLPPSGQPNPTWVGQPLPPAGSAAPPLPAQPGVPLPPTGVPLPPPGVPLPPPGAPLPPPASSPQPLTAQPMAVGVVRPMAAPAWDPRFAPIAEKPGIIPLRPLRLGEIYDGAFAAVRHNPAVMLGLSMLVILIATVVGMLLGQLIAAPFTNLLYPAFDDLNMQDVLGASGFTVNTFGQLYGGTVGAGMTLALASPIVSGLLTVSVSRSAIGDKASVGEVWARIKPRIGALIGWAIVQTLFLVIASVIAALALAGIIIALANVSQAIAAATGILLGLGLVVLMVWLAIRIVLIPPTIALEQLPMWQSVRRGWSLSRGFFWRLLGIYLLASIIVSIVGQVVTIPLTMVGYTAAAGLAGSWFLVAVVTTLATFLTTAISTIFMAGVVALLYIDVRMRREGLDVALRAAAVSPESGYPGVTNPTFGRL